MESLARVGELGEMYFAKKESMSERARGWMWATSWSTNSRGQHLLNTETRKREAAYLARSRNILRVCGSRSDQSQS